MRPSIPPEPGVPAAPHLSADLNVPRAPSVLVLRGLGLGDFATGIPALHALRRAYPGHEVVLAAPAILAPLALATGAVDRILATPSWVRRPVDRVPWCGRPPEVAVNLHGRGPRSHRALLALRPGRLLGFGCPPRFPDGPPWVAGEHEVARWCRMLAWYGIAADPGEMALPRVGTAPPESHGAIVIHPGASHPDRRWPVSRFAAVAAALAAEGHRIVVTGSAGAEADAAAALAEAAGLPAGSVLAGRTDITTLAAVVAGARAVVCGDTGVAHLASGYATPSVVLFGPVSPAEWGPPANRPEHVALWRGSEGLLATGPDEVLAAVRAVLRDSCPRDSRAAPTAAGTTR